MLCVICLHSFSSCFLFHCMSHGVSGQNIKLLSNAGGGRKECVIRQQSYLIISYKIICALLAADICRNFNLTFKYQGQSRYCLVCEKENKTSRRKKKYHIWQRRRLATGSAFSPIFHDTHWTLNARRHRCECVCASLSMHVWARIRSRHTAYKMYLVWLGAHSVAAAF